MPSSDQTDEPGRGAPRLRPRSLAFAVAALLLLLGLLVLGYVADRVNYERHLTEVRAETHRQLTQVGDRLNANLHADLQLVRGLVSVVNLIPGLDQAQFETAVRPLFAGRTQLRNIAAAPDMVIRLMYPMAGNERAIGLDYRKTPDQLAAAERARDTRSVVLAGPLPLVQGGTGLIVRLPVFVADGKGGERFWGLVSAVIESERLFRNSGLLDPQGSVEFALRGKDSGGPTGALILGREALFDERPAQVEIALPQGSWLLAAMPRGGWPTRADNAWPLRGGFALLCLVVLAAFAMLARAMTVADAAKLRAESASRQLSTLIEQSPDAMVIVNRDGRIVLVNRQTEQLFGWTREELLGQAPEMLLQPTLREGFRATQVRYFASLESAGPVSISGPIEFRGQHQDGSLIDVEVNLSPLPTDLGVMAVSVIRDIRARKLAEAQAQASERRASVIADHLPVLISRFDRDQRYVYANAYFARVFGVDHRALLGSTLHGFRGDADYDQLRDHVAAALAGQPCTFESQAVIAGKEHFFQQNYVPDVDADGVVQGFFSVSVDMSELKRSELRLAHSEKRLRMITDSIPALITHIDTAHHFTFANAAWIDFYQVRPEDMVGRHIRDAMGEAFYDTRRAMLEQALATGQRVQYDALVSVGARERHLSVALMPDFDARGEVAGLYTLGLDVTAQKAFEARLAEQAMVDHLTGLPNRRGFECRVEEAAGRARRARDVLGVVYVDVDRFKAVNDSQGHAAGDIVLQTVAQRLKASVRTTDAVARLGGDEFVVLLEALQGGHEAAAVAEKILAAMREPIVLADGSVAVSASMGIAVFSGADARAKIADVLAQADAAMYEAKRAGRNRFCVSDGNPPG